MLTNRMLFILAAIVLARPALAQESSSPNYQIARDLPYRAGPNLTDYQKERCRLDLYHPVDRQGFPTIVWFHGGGLTNGAKSIPAALQSRGVAIVAAGYRLATNVKASACLEDAAAAVAWTFQNIARYGGSTDRIFVSGHSAGGYLTAMLGLDKRWLAAQNLDANRIAGLIPFSPQAITHFTVRAERGIHPRQPFVDEFAPLFHVRKDAPPMLVITGDRERELFGRYEENAYFWRMMKVAGHTNCELRELPGFDHGGMAAPAFPHLLAFVENHTQPAATRDDILIADFESEAYGAWETAGEAFGPGPARGALSGQMAVTGFKGKGLVNSFYQGDRTTGSLTSPEFRIERKYIGFLIGGGKDMEKLALQLRVDGRVVRSATGPNNNSGGSEELAPESWDVTELIGQTASLRIVDEATGGWGHINVDQIVQTDEKPAGLLTNPQRDFVANRRYLHIPIKNGAPKRVVTLSSAGRVLVRNDIELANGEPDWWAPMDLSAWQGKSLTLQVDRLPDDSRALSAIESSDEIKGAGNLYSEPLRGQFHFSPRRGWNNDPNGLVFFNGEYHLFFQHNPYGWGWGNMHWGHAVSRDLVHWEELGDKLMPDDFGPMFSGSAVVDRNNTSGLGRDGKPPLVLIYTAAGNPTVQCIAASIDGRTFTKYEGNPVLKQITGGNRDPKVFWHEPSKKWVMVLYVALAGNRHTVHFFTSPNLREWALASVTDGAPGSNYLYECPDFFELPIDGDAARKKWVLFGANSEYAIGAFDGTHFKPEQSRLPGHRGRGFYAPQTYSDIPAPDGRRILVGWFQTETRGMPFNQSMTIPLELSLASTPECARLTFLPVRELDALRASSHRFDGSTLSADSANPLANVQAELIELRAEFEPAGASEIVFDIRGAAISYNVSKQEMMVNEQLAPAPLRNGKQRIAIYCDRAGLEVFASDGLTYMPMPFQPKPDNRSLAVRAKGGAVKFISLQVHELKSAWPSRP